MSRPALGNTRTYTYDADGRLTSATDALGNETTYAYDALGRVTTVTNAKGVSTTYTYDANGNLLTATDAAGTVAYAYDALGRCVSVTDHKGNAQSFTYDAKGQITKVTDKNGNETAYTYDPNGNITKTTDALGTEVLFQYNANGQLIKMTQNRVDAYHEQAETLVTLYQYDGRNLVTKVVRGENEELYTYDGNGNMLTKTDGDGYVTEYSYNSLDLVSHINYNDAKEVSYQYNKVGDLVKMDDWLGTTTFEVDLLGQLKKVTDHKGNVVSYEYDAVGNQTSITYPDETAVTKTYDNTYNLTKVTDAEQKNYLYEYDDAGRVTKLTYPNGWVEEYTYDAEGNLLKTVDTDPFHNNKKSTKFEYRYDAEGNLVSEYKRDTTASNRVLTTTYAYDALNRLTSAHEEGVGVNTTRTYQYDTLGNLIRQEQDGCIEYKYNGYSLDETTKCGTIPNSIGTSYWEYTYDGRGNLVSNDKYTRTTSGMAWENEETYVYDETNHLVQGKNEDGELSLYTYNGLGIRVGRELILKDNTHGYTDFHSQTPSVETGLTKPEVVKESYVIDYTSAIFNTLVMDEEGGFNYRWVYGLDRLSVKITSEGTNWWGQHVTTDILKDYTHQDRLGSTVNLSDQFGRVVGRADYNEWGEVTYKEALSITSSYRRIWPQLNYTGYDWDDVLGMYYAKARFYSADDKRFVAIDPIKGSITDPLSMVSYLYCVDNPLRWTDPLGLLAGNLDPYASYVYFDGNGGGGSIVPNTEPPKVTVPDVVSPFTYIYTTPDVVEIGPDGELITYPSQFVLYWKDTDTPVFFRLTSSSFAGNDVPDKWPIYIMKPEIVKGPMEKLECHKKLEGYVGYYDEVDGLTVQALYAGWNAFDISFDGFMQTNKVFGSISNKGGINSVIRTERERNFGIILAEAETGVLKVSGGNDYISWGAEVVTGDAILELTPKYIGGEIGGRVFQGSVNVVLIPIPFTGKKLSIGASGEFLGLGAEANWAPKDGLTFGVSFLVGGRINLNIVD